MENINEIVSQRAISNSKVFGVLSFVNHENLIGVHAKQKKNKAVGADGVTKDKYEVNLVENIDGLLDRMKNFSYKPMPVKRIYIPKANGKKRPLGLPSYEDRLVQGIFKEILEGVYEQKFHDFSFGFRPKRSCHDAVLLVNRNIMHQKVNYIVDCDIKGFFDNLNHEWMMKFLEHDIADKNFLRYVKRFLIGGIIEEGVILTQEFGTPQGSLMSTVLSNVYLHYVLDDWFAKVVVKTCRGYASLVRYADDFVGMFQYRVEALSFVKYLKKRLEKFGLEIEESKSRVLSFGRFRGTKETFDFLGFTFINGHARNGKYRVIFRTSKKKLKLKKQEIKDWLYANMHMPIDETIAHLNLKLIGHYRYYGIFSNITSLNSFHRYVIIQLIKSKRRRSQRSISLERMLILLEKFPIVKPKIYITTG